jgi:hypothetical protein
VDTPADDEVGLHNNANQFTNYRLVVLSNVMLIGTRRKMP